MLRGFVASFKCLFLLELKPHSLRIQANQWSFAQSLKDIRSQKDVLFSFFRRDVKVRYVQTRLGFLWALAQPLLSVWVFTFLFQSVLDLPMGEVNYPIFAFAGVICWTYFSKAITTGGQSMIASQALIKKVWFPKVLLPLSKTLVGMVDWILGILVLTVLALSSDGGALQPLTIVYVVLSLFLLWMTSLGWSLWVSATSIRYRDVQQVIPVAIQLGFFITPVVVPTELLLSALPESWEALIYFNPLVGAMEVLRAGFLPTSVSAYTLYISAPMAAILALSGWMYFSSVERKMPDWL